MHKRIELIRKFIDNFVRSLFDIDDLFWLLIVS